MIVSLHTGEPGNCPEPAACRHDRVIAGLFTCASNADGPDRHGGRIFFWKLIPAAAGGRHPGQLAVDDTGQAAAQASRPCWSCRQRGSAGSSGLVSLRSCTIPAKYSTSTSPQDPARDSRRRILPAGGVNRRGGSPRREMAAVGQPGNVADVGKDPDGAPADSRIDLTPCDRPGLSSARIAAVTCWSGNLCVLQLRRAERGDLFRLVFLIARAVCRALSSGWPGGKSVPVPAGDFMSQLGPVALSAQCALQGFPGSAAPASAHTPSLVRNGPSYDVVRD